MVFSNNLLMGAAGQGGGYEIDQSIRFNDNDSAYLNRTFGSAGNRKTYTFSGWFKRGNILGANTTLALAVNSGGLNSDIHIQSDEKLRFRDQGNSLNLITNQVFRDPGAWFHIVASVDTTQSTASNRAKLYLNGSQITSFSTETYMAQNSEGLINSADNVEIGRNPNGSVFWDGYMAELVFIDGQALTPASFGETNDDGVWIPTNPSSLTFGSNGYYLKGETASDLGEDFSGNGNDFTSSGLTSADQVTDSPTDNYATLNPLLKHSSVTFADGNLEASSGTGGWFGSVGTIGIQLGDKVYFEGKCLTNTRLYFGLSRINGTGGSINPLSSAVFEGNRSDTDYMWRVTDANTVWYQTTNQSVTVSAVAVNDIVGCSVDTDGTVKFYKNGTEIHSFSTTLVAGDTYMPVYSLNSATTTEKWEVRFGSTGISHQPTGFTTLNTANLPTPSITDGSAHFQLTLYTGDSSTDNTITGVGFESDFVWLKARTLGTGGNHVLVDSVRGDGNSPSATKELYSNLTNAESPTNIIGFNSDGFRLLSTGSGDARFNQSGQSYVAWCWKANGSGSSNEDGSINTTATSANTTAGFSVSTYTGTGANATVGHGLGIAPSFVIIKSRNDTHDWYVWTPALATTEFLQLNSTAAKGTASPEVWNSTAPTSSVVSLGTSIGVNRNTYNYVMYCFAEIPGYSSIGSYEGNGSTNGTFVYTGFRPSFLLVKNIDAADSWQIRDSKRDPFNVSKEILYPNTSGAEATSGGGQFGDLLSNGFKWRGADPGNNSAATFTYMAFAENPFGGNGVAPATAR